MTEEQRERSRARQRKYHANMTEEQRAKKRARDKRFRDGLTEEQRVRRRQSQRDWEARNRGPGQRPPMTEEQRLRRHQRDQRWRANRTAEQKAHQAELTRLSAQRYPEKQRARDVLGKAVAQGKIIKPDTCQGCGDTFASEKLHGHHEDYTQPLEVEWLCTWCHGKRHRKAA